MKKAAGIILLLIAAATLLGQNRSGFVGTPGVFRGFPGGAMPGVQRFTGSVVNPGSPSRNSPQIGIPRVPLQPPNFSSSRSFRTFPNRGFHGTFGHKGFDRFDRFDGKGFGFGKGAGDFGFGNGSVFAYPVFIGGGDYIGGDYPPPPVAAPERNNIFVIYPPPAAPVIINGGEARRDDQASRVYEVPEREVVVEQPRQQEPVHYLLAFRDKSVYAAVGYWVEGDTLHYITTTNTHNSVSLSLVDRELTAKLNQGSGVEVKLPPVRN